MSTPHRRLGLFGGQAREFALKHLVPHVPIVGPMATLARVMQEAEKRNAVSRTPATAARGPVITHQNGGGGAPRPRNARKPNARPIAAEGSALQTALHLGYRGLAPWLPNPIPRTAAIDAFDEAMLSGLLSGGANESAAALATAPLLFRGDIDGARTYHPQRLAAEDAKDAGLRSAYPVAWYPGLVLGAGAQALALRRAPVAPGRTVVRDGLHGAATGFLATDGDLADRSRGAASGALAGAGLSWAAPSVLRSTAPKPTPRQNYWDERASERMAERLSHIYDGWGHHYVPRRWLEKLGVPKSIIDSPFNVLKPPGMSRGDFYRLHFQVDPKFKTARVGKAYGGRSWRGADFGLEKYDLLGRVVEGAPDALRQTAGIGATAGGGLLYGIPEEEDW